MSEKVFKGVEMVGTSDVSFSHAIEVAVRRARQTLRGLSWFVVEEQRGGLHAGQLEYQVTLRVFFRLEDEQGPGGQGSGEVSGGGAGEDLSEGLDRARRAFDEEPTKEEGHEAAQKSSAGESAGRMKSKSKKRS